MRFSFCTNYFLLAVFLKGGGGGVVKGGGRKEGKVVWWEGGGRNDGAWSGGDKANLALGTERWAAIQMYESLLRRELELEDSASVTREILFSDDAPP